MFRPLVKNITSHEEMLQWPVYDFDRVDKRLHFDAAFAHLTSRHYESCMPYRTLLDKFGFTPLANGIEQAFPLPVRLFKSLRLQSVPQEQIVKTLFSSGTEGNQSRIVLDKTTAALQTKILSKIVTELVGKYRLPMLVIDCPNTVSGKSHFSARAAGILGFSMYGRDVTYALNEDMSINIPVVERFLEKYAETDVLLFGFTYIVWLHFISALEHSHLTLPLGRGLLIHGGGWKKLASDAVNKDEFKNRLNVVTGIQRVHSYYGMVEQTGSIFMECESGYLHVSAWSEILIRDVITHQVLPHGLNGLIQLFSLIPQSYPGHVLLSEDIGHIVDVDNCTCGRKGVYFEVQGRLPKSEARGCSDTYSR